MMSGIKPAAGWGHLVLVLFAALAAMACIPRMDIGISTLDDGFYAYAADAILNGKLIHRDFFSQYLGYQHYIHAGLFWLFGEDYLVLRYWLVVLQFFSAIFVGLYFREYGRWAQLVAMVIVTGFGFHLFNNPSTSWTCVTLALALATMLKTMPAVEADLRRAMLIGLLLGVMCGIRHPTGLFIGMGVFVHEVLRTPLLPAIQIGQRLLRGGVIAVLLLAAAALLAYMRMSGTFVDLLIWFIAPLSYIGYAIMHTLHADCRGLIRRLAGILAGTVLALLPVFLVTILSESWVDFAADLMTIPTKYSQMLGLTTFDLAGNMLFVALRTPSALSLLGVSITLLAMLFPLFLGFAIWLCRGDRLQQWLASPMVILSAFNALVMVGLVTTIYSAYLIAFNALAIFLLALVSHRRVVRIGVGFSLAVAAIFSLIYITPEINTQGNFSFFGATKVRELQACWLPRCSLRISSGNNRISGDAYRAVQMVKYPYSTVTVLPWGYHYEFSYPGENRSPYPDIRIPLYRHVPAAAAYANLMQARDPVILVAKPSMRDESVYKEFILYFARDFYKIYDDEIFMVLVKKNRK